MNSMECNIVNIVHNSLLKLKFYLFMLFLFYSFFFIEEIKDVKVSLEVEDTVAYKLHSLWHKYSSSGTQSTAIEASGQLHYVHANLL